MLVTVRGTYEDGIVRLNEPLPPTTGLAAGEVLVTFLAVTKPERAPVAMPPQKRFSFDEALALTADTSHVQVAGEVEAERKEEDYCAIF